MTEKVLDYDRAVVPQETGYWCGPASAQVVLNARGIKVPEATLAREIGTTVNGTDYIGLIERILDVRIAQARYTSVYMPTDPPTEAQRNKLWSDLVKSIDAGFGVVMNWVAPPGNHPIGIKGSGTPGYRGTIYHYVAAMGYDDTARQRAVWIADSGFAPFGYWVSFDQCATLIPPKGYAYADVTVTPTAAPVDPSAELLMKVMGGSVPFARYQALLPGVVRALDLAEANTVRRRAMWFAQIGHESGGLRYQTEIADGSAYEGRVDLGNVNRGDGQRYKGRDFVQVTGRSNYTALSRWAFNQKLVPTSSFFVDSPEKLATDEYAFLGTTWYWTTQRPLNDAADAGDLERATRYINGGLNGLDDRRRRYNNAMAFGDRLLSIRSETGRQEWETVMADTTKYPSRSPYRDNNDNIMTPHDTLFNLDAMTHAGMVEAAALRGEGWALEKVLRLSNGQGPGARLWYNPGQVDSWAITKARSIVKLVEQTNPAALAAYIASKGN